MRIEDIQLHYVATFDQLQESAVAVVLKKTPIPNQLHCGLAHKDDGAAFILHLAWHHDLRNELVAQHPEYFFVRPNLPTSRVKSVSALCRQIVKRERELQIPYGLKYKSTTLPDGVLVLGDGEIGLTCSTFVLCVFKSAGIDLLNTIEWPIRARDDERREQIANQLEDSRREFGYQITDEHIENVRTGDVCSRFRPEEVFGGAHRLNLPAEFSYAERAGEKINDLLQIVT